MPEGSRTAVEGDPKTGAAALPMPVGKPSPVVARFRQIAAEPGATRARVIDKGAVLGLGWHVPGELVEGIRAGAVGSERGHLGAMLLSHLGPAMDS